MASTLIENVQRWKAKKKALGLCVSCGKFRAKKNRVKCHACLKHATNETQKLKKERIQAHKCTGCNRQLHRHTSYLMCFNCRRKGWAKQKRLNSKLKDTVYNAYGGYICKCCGETEKSFLTIDHINNDGAKQRKRLKFKGAGSVIYGWLRRKKFPKGYQVLCWNCQWGKRKCGICPHQTTAGLHNGND